MTNRERWLSIHRKETAMMDDGHIYSQRFGLICREIVEKIETDPDFEPPTYAEVMAEAPWGP